MKKLTIYATVAARCTILLIGFVILPVAFALFVVTQIASMYLSALFRFATATKQLFIQFDHELTKVK